MKKYIKNRSKELFQQLSDCLLLEAELDRALVIGQLIPLEIHENVTSTLDTSDQLMARLNELQLLCGHVTGHKYHYRQCKYCGKVN